MYLYLGQDTVINTKKIIGIFDLDNTTVSKITKAFLANAQKNETVITIGHEIPKSFLVCEYDNNIVIYLTQISPSTLRKRVYSDFKWL